MIAQGQTFTGQTIQIDGCTFIQCTFVKCNMSFSGLIPANIDRCTFDRDCTWSFRGPAHETLRFLAGLYQFGGSNVVEATFDVIRGKAKSGGIAKAD